MANTLPKLKRTLGFPSMVFYGLGTIIGAGIYVLIGKIAGHAGAWTPIAFLSAAIIAGFTGLSYSELVARYPRSAGEAVYVDQAFNLKWLTQLVGWSVVFTGLVSAATLLKGFAGYFTYLIGGSEPLVITVAIIFLCALACIGVRQSVGVAVIITLLEIAGLALIVATSAPSLIDGDHWREWWQQLQTPPWQGLAAATFLAFYAFIGFEDMVNMAEEVKNVSVNLPRAIVTSIVLATTIYAMVALAVVIAFDPSVLAASPAPLATITEGSTWLSPQILALISLVAIINGVIVQLLMAPRVIYGMTQSSKVLSSMAQIHTKTQTPINATLFASALILFFALALPLTSLAQMTSTIILCLFILINTALILLKKRHPYKGFQVPVTVPIIGVITSLLLLVAQAFTA